MKNLDKRTDFERQWERAFNDAESLPSEGVWDKIDASLSKEEAGYFMRKASFFKMLAAASIAFAIGISLFSLNYYMNQTVESTVVEEMVLQENSDSRMDQDYQSERINRDLQAQNKIDFPLFSENENTEKSELTGLSKSENEPVGILPESNNIIEIIPANFETRNSSIINKNEGLDFNFLKISSLVNFSMINEQDFDMPDHIYTIPFMPRGSSKKKKENESGVYLASLDISTGVFDPKFRQGQNVYATPGFSAVADARVDQGNSQLAAFNTSSKDLLMVRSAGKENEPQIAFSYGANVGFKVSNRIVIQTGLAYRNATTTTSTTGYIEESGNQAKIPIVATHQYQFNGLSAIGRVPETNLTNHFEFASVPLEAGYIILDKKVNVTLLAGVSSEFFLNNRITDKSDFFETLSNSKGEVSSPYKSVYFNGTFGTMLGYTFAKNYQLMFEPSYRFAMNSFTKEDFYLNSYPSSFMVSFGVAYNFR